jgi:hypothetical protein
MISIYCASAFLGSLLANFRASSILAESAGAILSLRVQGCGFWLELQVTSKCVAQKRAKRSKHVMTVVMKVKKFAIRLASRFGTSDITYEPNMVRTVYAFLLQAPLKLIIILFI